MNTRVMRPKRYKSGVVILWNAWLSGISVKTHDDLDFCWPCNKIEDWQKKKILHYSGKVDQDEKRFFKKAFPTRS